MKKNLLALLALTCTIAVAQTPRLSLYEEFTGENCGPCAATNPGLNALLLTTANQQKIVAIKWQVPIPSAPSTTWSLYQTNITEINWRHLGWNGGYSSTTINAPNTTAYGYPSQWTPTNSATSGVNSAPTGLIDGQHQWVFGTTSDHPATLTQAAINSAQSHTAAFSITMARAWDATCSSVNLTVNITASAPFAASNATALVFRTVMVERTIDFATAPGSNGEKTFEDAAIKSFPTLQNGVAMAQNWTIGQTQTFTLNCPIPSYCRDKSEVAFVGFIQDDVTRQVAQAVRADKAAMPNDAKALGVMLPAFTCTNSYAPTVDVGNVGSQAITAMTITPYLNGAAQPDFQWTGSIAPGASLSIPMNALSLPAGQITFSYNISAINGTDFNMNNNYKNSSFGSIQNYQGTPVAEGFTATAFPPPNFMVYCVQGGATWVRVTSTGGFQLTSNAAKLDLYNLPNGSVHEMVLPPMNFTNAAITPNMSFDVAYSQYATGDNDMLEVYASNDCGANWTQVFSKAGNVLSTTGTAITPAFTPSSAAQWRTENVNLTGFNTGHVIVKFVATSDFGNNMYLDNINLKQQCSAQTLNITSNKPTNTVCKGSSVTMSVTGATTYSWANSVNSTTNTGTSITVSPTVTTVYTVTSTDAGSCNNTSAITMTVQDCTGLTAESKLDVQIFPNPNQGSFVMSGEFGAKSSVAIFNNLGQKVFEQALSPGKNELSTKLSAGSYHYVIYSADTKMANGSLVIAN